MKHSEQSEAGVPVRVRRQQTPAWIGMNRAFEGDDDTEGHRRPSVR